MEDLKVHLTQPLESQSPGTYETIRISRSTYGSEQNLEISLRRTIRVPDNGKHYDLPPDLGAFPIYNIQDHYSKLEKSVVMRGDACFCSHLQ
jgi:hypothetical protein